jgi:hypothetical protein
MPIGDSIVYHVAFSGANDETVTLDISFPNPGGTNGLGWWRFIYTKTYNDPITSPSTDLTMTAEVCGATDSNTVLRLTGPFWQWDPLGGPIGTNNGDGTFSFTFSPAPPADMEYLFVLDGVQENMVASGLADSNWSCTPVTDYSTYANRQWLTTDPLVLSGLVYGSCSPCPSTDLVITTEVCAATDSNTVLMLTGPFWGWNPTGGPTALNNGDGTFTFTFSPAPSADMEYKFILDGVQEDMVASGTASGNWGCTPVTDYSTYANRQWLMTDPLILDGLVYGSCDSCSYVPPAPTYYDVTYSVNTANMSVPVGPNGIYVGGAIYGVATSAMAFQLSDPNGDGIWTGTDSILSTTVGNYTLLNSPTSSTDFGAKEDLNGLPCADAANNNDRILPTINGDTTLLHCFGTCDTDGTCPLPPSPVNITFQVDMTLSPYSGTPILRGSWNWGVNGDLMTDANGDNIWEFTKLFTSSPGAVYEYVYSVDTGGTQGFDVTEQNDPLGLCTNGNSQYTNRVLSIPSLDSILGVVCFESCESCRLSVVSICDSSYLWNGVNYNTTGIYIDTVQSSLGQDSIVNLDLTINNGSSLTVPLMECDSFIWDGVTYDSTGLYTNVYQGVNGCDSTVTLDLMIYSVSASIDTTGGDLVASGGLSYLWNTGDTSSTITPVTNGVYTVVILDSNGCADTASFNVTYITSTDIWDNLSSSISLYPNPVNEILNISSSDNIKSLEIKDLLGRVIFSSSELNSNNISLNTSSFSNNVYLVSCVVNDQLIVKKIIISR